MSANYNSRDGFCFIPCEHPSIKLQTAVVESTFNEQVDFDIEEMLLDIKIKKLLKRGCVIRIIIFPFEWVLTRTLMGKDAANVLTYAVIMHYYYLTNKISMEKFKEVL